ncbi:MAG: metallophosphoesterase [Oscillatoriales cyanobacterium]|uniref:Metallophosphoesterase n=1 Tax=Microcoleus anatoxicus PTRS2 TaxID=2705321 RepID=A0ABU8YK54_9CYAN|nr:MAG: metallophosphoesterase [Oscillatoriales cyanobacterium]TAD96765.1 MAG: metallophosphoesterase [Oscillatoriales cyanobacterium]TAE04479.1 MAG: metallophosphoesterase [Oscillatoriales cyanobacterium]TAF06554.1 MAG: metallophosphoesterase [Oscillatoriales cyanobacterium]TAF44973.1 MAG: metallophosphoesterase [Oscillatoriales cyanobacterium]
MHRLLTGKLRVEHLTIPIANLPANLSGTKLVQLTDFHYDGVRLSEGLLFEAIAAANEAEADLIFLTGDFITLETAPIHDLVQRLKNLQSRRGIYAVLGNHDHYWPGGKIEVTNALNNAGIRVLYNEATYPLGENLALIGFADFWSGDFKPEPVMTSVDISIPRIVLSHNPDTAEKLQGYRIDLQFSGHTHGGQIVIPGIGPVYAWLKKISSAIPQWVRNWMPFFSIDERVVSHWEWASGLHRVGNNLLYVNRGLGTYAPGRLFCPPEVTVITLICE